MILTNNYRKRFAPMNFYILSYFLDFFIYGRFCLVLIFANVKIIFIYCGLNWILSYKAALRISEYWEKAKAKGADEEFEEL